MRDIKFRAWDKASKIWLDTEEYVIHPDNGDVGEVGDTGKWVELVDVNFDAVLEQYTGLKDKNGVEIYEGDIVEVKSDLYKDSIGVIKFWSFSSSFSIFKNSKKIDLPTGLVNTKYDDTSYEVIGNVHENQDLLNDTDCISPDNIGNDIHEFLHRGDK